MSALSALSALSPFQTSKRKIKSKSAATPSEPTRRLVGFSVQPFLGDGAFKNNKAIKLLAFVNADNQKLACWYPRKQSAREFCTVNNIRGDPATTQQPKDRTTSPKDLKTKLLIDRKTSPKNLKPKLLIDRRTNIFTGGTPVVTIYFPMKSDAFVVKTVRLQGVASYTRVLETVEAHLKDAVKFWMQQIATSNKVTTRSSSESRAASFLDGFNTCHLMVSRGGGYNKIYVRTQL